MIPGGVGPISIQLSPDATNRIETSLSLYSLLFESSEELKRRWDIPRLYKQSKYTH